MADTTTRSARQQVLDTAAGLFYKDGFRAVGIDTIVAESGVSKMTLYRHFPSKDDLIVAYLQDSNTRFWAWFEAAIAPYPDSARDQIVGFFAALEKLVTKPACHGCPFLIAATEFPDRKHAGHQVALAHKQAVRARLRDLAGQAGASDAAALADQLFLLMDGAFMAVRLFGTNNPAVHLAQTVEQLLAIHLI